MIGKKSIVPSGPDGNLIMHQIRTMEGTSSLLGQETVTARSMGISSQFVLRLESDGRRVASVSIRLRLRLVCDIVHLFCGPSDIVYSVEAEDTVETSESPVAAISDVDDVTAEMDDLAISDSNNVNVCCH